MEWPVKSEFDGPLFVKSVSLLTIGVLFATNHFYLSYAKETFGIGYISSPWVAAAATVYLSTGAVLIGLSIVGVPLTFYRAVIVALVSLPAVWLALQYTQFPATGHLLSFQASTNYTFEDYTLWLAQLFPLALMLPLGVTPNRRARYALLAAMGLSLLMIVLQSILSSPADASLGYMVPILYAIVVGIGIVVLGSPLYFLGRNVQGSDYPANQNNLN